MKILQYRFCRLPFGLKPSPAILNAVLQKHLDRYSTSEREVYQVLSQSFYVDDFVGGVTSDNDSVQMYQAAKRILKEGGFNLRKWYTNSAILQEKIIQATSNVSIRLAKQGEGTGPGMEKEHRLSNVQLAGCS